MSVTLNFDQYITQIGQLIGLIKDDNTLDTTWFEQPVQRVLAAPTRVTTLLEVLGSYFDPVDGVQYTTISNEAWYAINIGAEGASTGLALYAPGAGSTAGVLGLGIFAQTSVDDLTVSLYGRIPLFYLQEGSQPVFVLTNGDAQYKVIDVGLDVYSSTPIQVTGDSAFNLATLTATADFASGFDTNFALTFYENFDPGNSAGTALPTANVDTIIGRIAQLVLQANYWLNSYIGEAPVTIGDVLSLTMLVKQTTDPESGDVTYSFDQPTFQQLQQSTPAQIFELFLTNLVVQLIDKLATSETLLVPVEGGGIYAAKDATTNSYGLRFAIPSYTLNPGAPGTQYSIVLGEWFTQETAASNWIKNIDSANTVEPGVTIFFLQYDGKTLSTTSHFEVASIGFNITGGGDAPLINQSGYTLNGAEMRFYLDASTWEFGFGIRLDDVGFPLGPSFDTAQSGGGGSNVVAQNLVAGPSSKGSDDSSAANPTFSATAAYIKGHDPLVEVFDADGNKTDLIWFPIQRRLGPLTCRKIGIGIDGTSDPHLDLVFDGGVTLGGLNVDLDQLSIGVDLKQPTNPADYTFDLQGLTVDFSAGSVEISGGLIKATDGQGNIAYNGEALLKFGDLAIAAMGSYSALPNNGGTSLFIFAVLNEPLGGPAFFFVTGLMAGFGYNRSLLMPDQNNVDSFPLLSGLTQPSTIGGTNPTPGQALQQLQTWVPATRGSYWIAAGVQFTTFEIIKTTALLIVEFGNELMISVLGTSVLQQPQEGDAWVYAKLGVEVVFLPDAGELKATAVLSPDSYVLTPDAHLTGGFAFYSWWGSNPNAGDFVFTVGGYHPAFNVPDYYPQEPRLGINWKISDSLAMTGTAYFAITPVAMMAGGGLQITFADGPLRAWLAAQADVILYWKPFYLMADVSVSVGIAFRVHVWFVDFTISVEIGADFHLWGPPIGGTVHVDWYIVSFTIGFGADKTPPPQLTWENFKGMLPTKPGVQDPTPRLGAMAITADTPPPTEAYLHINAVAGLKTSKVISGVTQWLVRAGSFKVTIGSAIPATVVVVKGLNDAGQEDDTTFNKTSTPPTIAVGLKQVNGGISPNDYQSTQTIQIMQGAVLEDIETWEIDLITTQLPPAMWGAPDPAGQGTNINPASPTVDGITGVTMYPTKPDLVCTPEMVITEVFEDLIVNAQDSFRLSLDESAAPVDETPNVVDSFPDIMKINNTDITTTRSALFDAIQMLGYNGWTNSALPLMAERPGIAFADEPMEVAV